MHACFNLNFFLLKQKAKQLSAKKAEGNAAFKSGKFEDAYKIYTDALNIDEHNKFTNSKLYCNRATACSKVCVKITIKKRKEKNKQTI